MRRIYHPGRYLKLIQRVTVKAKYLKEYNVRLIAVPKRSA